MLYTGIQRLPVQDSRVEAASAPLNGYQYASRDRRRWASPDDVAKVYIAITERFLMALGIYKGKAKGRLSAPVLGTRSQGAHRTYCFIY